jgi:tetratricopeptide (TPR) repeat protein
MPQPRRNRNSFASRRSILFLTLFVCGGAYLFAQDAPDSAAELIARARQAEEKNDHASAAARYRQFLNRFPRHAEVPSVRRGLALALIDGPTRDYKAALEQLQALGDSKDPTVLFYLGWCQRGLGKYAEAAPLFAAVAVAFTARVTEAPKADAPLPADVEAAAGARCYRAEMLLRLGKLTEGRDLLAGLLKDRGLERSRCRPLALYYHGYASLLLKDTFSAGRSLSLAAAADAPFAGHAQYLLAGVHQADDERAEATAGYEAVLAEHEARKAAALEALKQPDALSASDKSRFEALVQSPPPEHVGSAQFALGLLSFEAGRFEDAQQRFAGFVQQYPQAALARTARLVQGMCLVEQEQPAAAVPLLEAVVKDERLVGTALRWLAKARAAHVEGEDSEARTAAVKKGIDTLRLAIDKLPADAGQRGVVFLELAALHQQAGQHREAAALFALVLDQKLTPGREEEVRQRRLSALNLAGDHTAVLQSAEHFLRTYPRSALRPEVVFRRAESAYFLGRLDEAARGYQEVIDKFPESGNGTAAQYGLAWTHHRRNDFEKARAVLEAIPAAERGGELAFAPYLQADCLLRTMAPRADDALAAGKLQEQLERTVALLNDFSASQPDDPAAPDALLRLSLCQQRLAALVGKPEERNQLLQAARESCDRALIEYPGDALQPFAAFARARCLAAVGDAGQAIARLRSFARPPLDRHPIAPLALLCRANLLRGIENGAPEAVKVLAECRRVHEPALLKDAARAGWVTSLRFHHGLALKEAGHFAEARALFDTLMQHPDRPEAIDAAWRRGQTLVEEGWQQVDRANQVLGQPNLAPADAEAARTSQDEGWKRFRDGTQYLETQAEQWKPKRPDAEARAWMLYEAAWQRRALIDQEIERARIQRQAELHEKLKQEAAKKATPGQPPPEVPPPDVPLAEVPLQASEMKARANYLALITGFLELPLALDARLELAELYLQRDDHTASVKLLEQTLDKEPPPELTAKVRLRLGAHHLSRGDLKAALAQFDTVSAAADTPFVGQGHYRAAECLLRQNDVAAALKRLALFRDVEALHNVGGVSDIAVLRLGQTCARLGQVEEARQAFEVFLGRFGDGSPWSAEAHYGFGWALHQKKEYQAARQHFRACGEPANDTSARAHLLIAASYRLEKRYADALNVLKAIPGKGASADVTALALVEAADVARLAGHKDEAAQWLQQVSAEQPKSPWAAAAKERLKDDRAGKTLIDTATARKLFKPDLAEPPGLENLGQQRDSRASLDDPTEEAAQAWLLARRPRERTAPAPLLPATAADPFAHRNALPVRGPLPVGALPILEDLRMARP